MFLSGSEYQLSICPISGHKATLKKILSNILLSEFSLNKNNIGTAHFSKVHLTPFCFHKRLTLAPVFAS